MLRMNGNRRRPHKKLCQAKIACFFAVAISFQFCFNYCYFEHDVMQHMWKEDAMSLSEVIRRRNLHKDRSNTSQDAMHNELKAGSEKHGDNKRADEDHHDMHDALKVQIAHDLQAFTRNKTVDKIPQAKQYNRTHDLLSSIHNRPVPKKKQAKHYNRTLAFLHIGKAGGTSFDNVGVAIAEEAQYNYAGRKHFDWSAIEKMGTVGDKIEVVTMLREPVARAISHFYFARGLDWTKGAPIRKQNLTQYLQSSKQNLLDTRDIWQDGQAAVSWLTGTHIGSWVGIPKDQVEERERRAQDSVAMCHLAANRLEQTKWFGLLEESDRSMELLQHAFNLLERPSLPHNNRHKNNGSARLKRNPAAEEDKGGNHKNDNPATEEDNKCLASLMPQDIWLYEYAKLLFEARWTEYKTGIYQAPERPPLPEFTCVSTRFELSCSSGPLADII
jgi:hypothetical protein